MDYQRCNRSLDSLLSTCLPQLPDPGSIMPTGQIPHFLALSSRLTGLPRWLTDKESSCQCRRHEKHRFCPWVAKIPWKRNANPLQNSCLRNPTDRGAGWDTVCGAAKNRTRLSSCRVIMFWPQLFVSKFISPLLYLLFDSHVNFLHFSSAGLFDICSLLFWVFPYTVLSSRIPWSPPLCVQTLPVF